MSDILYDAAKNYSSLLDKGYHIVLGRKGRIYEINLRFDMEDFFHLAGLQHLKDVTFPSQNRERIFKEIISGNITIDMIKDSEFYEECDVETRFTNLYRLETMLDSSRVLFYINHNAYKKYTRIVADYLCRFIVLPITEEVEIKIPAFRVVPVFDVSQTDGKELPDIGVNELSGSVEDYEDFMQALTEVSPVPITYEDIEGEAKGYFHTTDQRIAIQEGMSQSQTVKTAIHEVAHAKLHDRERNQDIDAVLDKDRNTKEVEAESVAYTVCQHFGIDTSDYSFGYIAGWSSDRDMKELKSSLDTIRKTASELITGIEDRLAKLQKDRLAEQEQNKESILLIQNDDLTQYSLVSVVGMDRQELMDVLSAMSEDDKLSIQAYLESKGAWTTEIANEDTKEFGEYHLDVRYNTDTEELVDMKERKEIYDKSMEPIAAGDVVVKFSGSMGSEWEISKITNMSPDEVKKLLYDMALLNENEWDGDYNAYLKEHGAEMTLISSSAGLNEHAPQFFDFAYDADTGVSASTELSAIQQAENLINRMEHGATVFTDDERNLIVNYNYKFDDMEKTRELVEKLAYMIENQPVNEALTVIDAQAEIDALPDGMIVQKLMSFLICVFHAEPFWLDCHSLYFLPRCA